jgi:hypothetical protein
MAVFAAESEQKGRKYKPETSCKSYVEGSRGPQILLYLQVKSSSSYAIAKKERNKTRNEDRR